MRRNWKDVVGGGTFALLGLYVAISAFSFGIGTASRMGAGYYPLVLGITAILLGLAIAAMGLREPAERPRIAWKPFLAVIAGLLAFFLLVERAGLIPAVCGLVALSTLADEDTGLVGAIGLAVVIAVAAWLVFVVGLRLPLAGIEGLF